MNEMPKKKRKKKCPGICAAISGSNVTNGGLGHNEEKREHDSATNVCQSKVRLRK
jgi:hypothetical protein